jgi:hypothetical protein
VYLGQFALLAAAAPAMALNGAAAALVGRSAPLVVLAAAATLALAVREARARRWTPASPEAEPGPLALIALASLGAVVALYARHLSGLGLDSHEHVAWARQIALRGFVPLTEPGTAILGDYPRTFHVLAALWNAVGLGPAIGPFVEVMPFVQAALPVLAVAELLVAASPGWAAATGRRWGFVLGTVFLVHAFVVVPTAYPVVDLSGTPRFSSAGLLLLPAILAALSRAGASLSVAILPLVVAWAVTWNPIVVVLVAVVAIPLQLALPLALPPPGTGRTPRARRWTFAASCALAACVLAQDPWVASQAAARSPVYAGLVHRVGLFGFDEAVRSGLASPRDKSVHFAVPAAVCRTPRCVGTAAWTAVREAAALPATAASEAWTSLVALARAPSIPATRDALRGAVPLRPSLFAPHAPLPYVLLVSAGMLAAGWRWVRRRSFSPPARLLLASLAVQWVASMGMSAASRVADLLNDRSHDGMILVGYLAAGPWCVSSALLALPLLAAIAVLAEPALTRAPARTPAEPPGRRRAALACVAVWLCAPAVAVQLNLDRPRNHHGFWTRIGLGDLRALHRVEEAIPPEDAVIVPAEHWNIADWEHWVIPVGPTTALLPYGDRRYLFDVYIGAGYPLSWHDLQDRLCSPDATERARFLRAQRARWLLVRDTTARDDAEALGRARACGAPVAPLWPQLPAVRADRGIYLFALQPP